VPLFTSVTQVSSFTRRNGTQAGGGGGAPATFDYYVDSVAGSDSNAGTEAAPFQTIAAAQTALASAGTSLALVRGSTWRETLNIPRTAFVIGVVGAGAAPVFIGSDAATGWALHADQVTYPNVWQLSWTRTVGASTELLGLWTAGVRPTYRTSLALLAAGSNGDWHASSRTGANPTVYMKSTVNPDTLSVEISRRDWAINGHTATLASTYTAEITGPIEAKNYHGHYNALSGGPGFNKRAYVRDGTIHHMVSEAELVEDVIADGFQLGFGQAQVPLTAYRAVGTGYSPVWKRAMVFGLGYNVGDSITAILSHGSAPEPDLFTAEQFAAKDVLQGVSTNTAAYASDGAFFDAVSEASTIQAATTTIRYAMSRDPKPTTNGHFPDVGPGNGVSKTRLIENCVIYSGASPPTLFRVNSKFGSIIIRNCIIVLNTATGGGQFLSAVAAGGTLNVTFEYNVIVRTFTGGGVQNTMTLTNSPVLTSDHNLWLGYSVIDCSYNGVNYRPIADWQAQGYDTNSKHLATASNYATIKSTYFEGAPENGDFRLKAGIGTFTDGVSLNLAGPQYHWDWNARAVAAGAPTAWPTLPANETERRAYIADPAAWDFYP
jgi:hypothetical protein